MHLSVMLGVAVALCVCLAVNVSARTLQKRAVEATAEDIGDVQQMFSDIGGRQEVDLVVALDRSKSMSEEVFYLKVKKLTRAILQQYATLDFDYVRLAVITFAVNSTVEIDYISNPDTAKTKCALFNGNNTAWDRIMYRDNLAETNIRAAFTDADQIFRNGQINRPQAKQVVFLITDGKYNDANDPIQESRQLKEAMGVTIYGVGIGVWLEIGNVRILTSETNDLHLYADFNHWFTYVSESGNYTSYQTDTSSEWRKIYTGTCSATCADMGGSCYCDIDRGYEQCLCNPGDLLDPVSGQCLACPVNTYKSHPGNDAECTSCPPGTSSPERSTDRNQCQCDSEPCNDPCEPNPCNQNANCIAESETDHRCECEDGWEGPLCDVNTNECAAAVSPCKHSSSCIDGLGTGVFTCACTNWGYMGRYCEIEEDECVPGLCLNGGNCTDLINNFNCVCPEDKVGRYCQDDAPTPTPVTTTSTTTTTGASTKPSSSTPLPVVDPKDNTLWIIIGASVGGGVLILIIIIVVSVVVCRKKRAKSKQESKEVKNIARQFSGFWKKKTVRGKNWMEEENRGAGTPSVPLAHRPDLLNDTTSNIYASVENLKTDEYTELHAETMTLKTGMESWQNYITELEESKVIERAIIAKTTGGDKTARTGAWITDLEELTRLQGLMEAGDINVPLLIQDSEFHILENDGTLACGATIGSSQEPKIVTIGRTKTYLVVAISVAANDDGKCRKEVQWIVDHISGEGY